MTNVTPGCFVDSNILVYSFDAEDEAKRLRSREVLRLLAFGGRGVISTQVLNEVYSTLTRKKRFGLALHEVRPLVTEYADTWNLVLVSVEAVLQAMKASTEHGLSYYDAVIWATARDAGLEFLLSEDGQHDRVLDGVRYLNPFAPDFDLAQLS
jgi:predicted nucleic acid-binding protein